MIRLKVIIVEDEPGAADNLQSTLADVAPYVTVVAILTSIEDTVTWLSTQPSPDLAFFDIQLSDGLSFEIFQKTEVTFPVIFTTAYDHHAIEAFKVNSIDYLLKPIKEEALAFSIRKYEQLRKATIDHTLITQIFKTVTSGHTATFLVRYKDKLIPITSDDVSYFSIDQGLVHACTFKNQVYPIDHTLEELEESLDEGRFFRANRQYIINRAAIRDIELYFNGRLAINLTPKTPELVLVSKARAGEFRAWMKGV